MKRKNRTSLENTMCIVAGANGLLGKSILEALLDAGAEVLALDQSFSGKFSPLVGKLSLDLTNEKQVKLFFKGLAPKKGAPKKKEWAFVNASYPRTENWATLGFENVSAKDFNDNVEMHLGSAFLFTREAVSFLKAHGGGSILNFGSIYGLNGPDLSIYEGTKIQNPSPYAAIKGGITGLTRYVSTAYGKNNIRANVLCPGGVFNKQDPKFVKAYEKRTPLGRMASPEDIAGVAAFLVSPAASYITGQVLAVDGGWTAW